VTADGRRPRRVAEAIRARIAEALAREVADPRLSSLVLTGVSVTDDLSLARISVRLLVGDEEPGQREAALGSLRQAAGRLRRLVGPRLRLRRMPEFRFEYDTGHDATRRVEELLDEIHRESRGSDE
jgi:ribosome-binding factor A